MAQEIISRWSFDSITDSSTLEEVSKVRDSITGYSDPVPGICGGALQLDGYTGCLIREKSGLELPKQFTIHAWVMLDSYPWFRCPVFDLRRGEKDGALLAINHDGYLTMAIGQPTTWAESTGPKLPLKQWLLLDLVAEQGGPSCLYLNGAKVGNLDTTPELGSTKNHRLTIGRNAILEKWPDYQYVVSDKFAYLDGTLDDVCVYGAALNEKQIQQAYAAKLPLPNVKSAPRVLPTGPDGPAEFGADYTRLNYTKQWDRLWRVGDSPDVLVRFSSQNCKLIFWRGTSYVPCWVTENGIWYTNEWLETWGKDVRSCAEPMMDRDCRFSNVSIIENTPARTIVHWRYALVDTEHTFVAKDVDEKGEWADEYYIIYPDGIGIRKIDLFYSNPLRKHDWEESIILLPPGRSPEQVINDPEVTLANMAGECHAYSWRKDLPVEMKEPKLANIHFVNLNSRYKPFYVVSPEPFESAEGKYESPFFRSYSAAQGAGWRPASVPSIYGWWNHWPVTPVPGDGRWVVNNDQPSHFNLTTFTQWKDYFMNERVKTRIMLHGMTDKRPEELVPLAKSWLYPPQLDLKGGTAKYEAAQRAYLITSTGNAGLSGTLMADMNHPAVNPAFVLYDLRLDHPVVQIDGKTLTPDKDYQHGVVRELNRWKTLVWINREWTHPTAIGISQ